MKRIVMAVGVVVGSVWALVPATAAAQEVDKKTERTWKAKCSSCHGMDGKGETKKGQELQIESMATAEFQKKYSDAHMLKVTNEGLNETRGDKKVEMDGYKDQLKPGEAEKLVELIRSFGKAK